MEALTASAARLAAARRIVVKIGSALLVSGETGRLRVDWLEGLAADVASLRAQGKDVIVVSSGSIALGRRVLRLSGATGSPLASASAAAAAAASSASSASTLFSPSTRGLSARPSP